MPSIRRKSNSAGLTLVELMIATVLLGIISLGMVGAFGNIAKSIQYSRARTLASNLAQEQMQILKQKAFNKVLLTTATLYVTDFGSQVPYDAGYYTPETLIEGGISYRRYTHVQVADENSGSLSYLGAVADTGMKAITVTVIWSQGGELKKVQVRNILTDIEMTPTNSVFSGQVTDAVSGSPINGALVTVAENVGWADFSNATGNYVINLSPGSYRLTCSARGYFSKYVYVSIAANATSPQNFSMSLMGYGTLRGQVWTNDHLVISQVVGSNLNAAGFCEEFVEVYNPSTFTWTMASGLSAPVINLSHQRAGDATPTTITMNYANYTVAPNSYYLFANTSTVTMAGVTKTVDATYQTSNTGYPDIIYTSGGACASAGSPNSEGVGLRYASTGGWIDQVGWQRNLGSTPDILEGSGFLVGASGFQDGQQFVRKTSTAGASVGPGRAYDSGSNSVDFVLATNVYQPRHSGDIDYPIAGTPAIGAYVTASDGLSQVTSAVSVGTPPYAQFTLTSVATGTWNVLIASGNYAVEIDTVVVTNGATTYIPNAGTVPAWSYGLNSTILSLAATQGYISGIITDALGAAITPAIKVGVGAVTRFANTTNGAYFLPITPGTYDITANISNTNNMYISQTSATISVPLGQIVSNVDFTLTQGGRISGFATRDGTNPLMGVSFIATDASGNTRDGEVTGSDGRFLLINLATGSYTVEPILSSGETATPAISTAIVTAGSNVFSTTFTITGTFGHIRGGVTASGQPVRTGVLVLATTSTLSGAPPSLSYSATTGTAFYLTNSYEDGNYLLDVRGSTSMAYNLYAYYTTFSGTSPVVVSRSRTNVSVTPGNTVSSQDFSW